MSTIRDFREKHDFPCWCGRTEATVFCSKTTGNHRFVALKCMACGTQRMLPRVLSDQASAETLYNEYGAPDVGGQLQVRQSVQRTLERLAEVRVHFAPQSRVLDVGCGSGLVLEAICQQFGCAGKGIDVDRRRIEKARARSKRATFECGLFTPANHLGSYDILLSIAVVEHVVDPVGFLKQLNLALVQGGRLFLLTPNSRSLSYRFLRSWWRELLSIGEHIYLFTPESLERCAALADFKLVRLSSAFDYYVPRLNMSSFRECLISLWSIHRELVKRACGCFAGSTTGDILYAHFEKL